MDIVRCPSHTLQIFSEEVVLHPWNSMCLQVECPLG